jgi:thioredoxin 1
MSKSQIIEVKSEKELKTIIEKAKAIFLDYSTSWCGPCKRLGADLHTWIDKENKYENVTVVKVMIDNEELKSIGEDIESVPTIHFYKSGKRVEVSYTENGKCNTFNEIHGYDKKKVLTSLEFLNSHK